MAEKQQQRKMVNIDVVETSGVDHPAHLAEGWIVCKSATAQDVEGIFGPLVTEGTAKMATNDTAEPTVEDLTKALAAKDQELAAAKDALTKATAKPEEPTSKEEMLKALPAPVREMILKSEADAAELKKQADADREELQKERDARLDERAITETAALYKSVAIDAKTVGPALRRLALHDADLHKSVTEALAAADAQIATGNLFKSVGDNGINNDAPALGKLEKAATELMEKDAALTKPQAIAKAAELHPDLYDEYQNEKAGK
jgi:hypothetical protein